MPVRPRGDGFQADFTYKEQRYRAQFPSHQEALQWELDARAALVAGRPLPSAPTGAGGGSMTLAELKKRTVERFWKGTKNETNADRNAQEAVDFFGGNTTAASLTPLRIDDYVGHLMRKGQSGGTINRKLAALSKMLRHGVRLGELKAVPEFDRRKEGEARERFLNEREAQALIDLLEHWGQTAASILTIFLLDTGARISEAYKLRVRDVGEDRVTFGVGKDAAKKNGEWRVVPLTRRLRELLPGLMSGLPDDAYLFERHINRHTYVKHYVKAVDHLNLGDDVVIHTLRHTCASWLVQRGVDLRRVKDWMGHKSIQTTMRYAKLAPTSLFEAVNVLDDKPDNVVPLRRPA